MKKFKVVLILCIILFGYMLWNVCYNTDILAQSMEKDNLRFKNIAFVTSDSQGNIYLIDRYRTRIVKLDDDGDFVFKIDDWNLFHGTNSYFDELTVDETGNIYAVCDILDEHGYYVTTSEIRQYEPDGSFGAVLERISHSHSGRSSRGKYIDLEIVQDDLYYYTTTDNITTMYKLSLTDGQKTECSTFQTGNIDSLYRVTGSKDDVVYYQTYDRKIYKTDSTGITQEIFNGSSEDLTKEIVPMRLVESPDGTLYFLDTIRDRLYKILPGKEFNPDEFISLENLVEGDNHEYTALMPVAGDRILVADQNSYVILDQNGGLLKKSNLAGMTRSEEMRIILAWAQVVLCVLLLVAIVLILYFKILNRRLVLFLKYALVLIPSFIILMSLIGYYVYGVFSENIIDETLDTLAVTSRSGSLLFHGDLLDNVMTPEQVMEPGFKSILGNMEKILEADSGNQKLTGMYATIYKKVGDRIYVLYDYDWNSMPFTVYASDYRTSDFAEVFVDGTSSVTRDDADVNGEYMDYITPIYNSQNEIVGAFEAGVSKHSIDDILKSLQLWFMLIVFCSTLVIAFLILVTNRFILTSVNTLRQGVLEVASGNLDVQVNVNTRDEVGDLCDGFNIMADRIRSSIIKSRQTSEAYFRFVPERILQLLGKSSITSIETGDTVRRDMSVMSLNIRSFYSISASLSAEQNYAYINSLLEQFGPVVRENGGIVEKYLGADITAIFPDRAEDAVQSSVQIISIMERMNAEPTNRQEKKLDIGIGLYKGDVMLGTIGEEKRMECTMLMDNGNIPQDLCKLSSKLGVSILASESVLQSLENNTNYLHRYIGKVYFEGMAKPIKIYDIFQGNNKYVLTLRAYTKETFEEGVRLYEKGKFLEARTCFIDVLRHDKEDGAAKIYFYLSDQYYQTGQKPGWDGALVV